MTITKAKPARLSAEGKRIYARIDAATSQWFAADLDREEYIQGVVRVVLSAKGLR